MLTMELDGSYTTLISLHSFLRTSRVWVSAFDPSIVTLASFSLMIRVACWTLFLMDGSGTSWLQPLLSTWDSDFMKIYSQVSTYRSSVLSLLVAKIWNLLFHPQSVSISKKNILHRAFQLQTDRAPRTSKMPAWRAFYMLLMRLVDSS